MSDWWRSLRDRLRRLARARARAVEELFAIDRRSVDNGDGRGPSEQDPGSELALDSSARLGRRRDRSDAVSTAALDAVIGDCDLYERGRRRPGTLPFSRAADSAAAAAERPASGRFVWIDLDQPQPVHLTAVAQALDLPALAVEDAITAHQRPKLEVYDDLVFAVLKPVRYVNHDEVVDVAEIAVFLGPGFVVTVRHGESDVLRRVRAELDGGLRDTPALAMLGPAVVLYRAADLAVDDYEEALRSIDTDVDHIESQVFATGSFQDNSERIYNLKREIAEFRRAVQPLAAALLQLSGGDVPGVGPQLAPYFRDVHDHVLRTTDGIEGHDRLLSDVLQADLARVAAEQSRIAVRQNEISVRQNEDMRRISAWAAIGLVPTAIAGIYGMNFDNLPELHWRYGYFVVLGVIGVVCLSLHRLFRRNGWL